MAANLVQRYLKGWRVRQSLSSFGIQTTANQSQSVAGETGDRVVFSHQAHNRPKTTQGEGF